MQVNVDVDLSSRRQRKPQAAANSNGGSPASLDETVDETVGTTAGQSAAAMAANSTRQSSVADVSTPLHQEAAAAASNDEDTGMSGDSILRSAAKGLVWRLFSTSATVGIALLVLHDVIQVGLLDFMLAGSPLLHAASGQGMHGVLATLQSSSCNPPTATHPLHWHTILCRLPPAIPCRSQSTHWFCLLAGARTVGPQLSY